MSTLRPLTASEVTFTVSIEPEDIPVRGNAMASGDDDADRELEDALIERLNRGDAGAWCTVVVTTSWKGRTAKDYLGGCSLNDTYTAETVADEHGMKEQALDRLNQALADLHAETASLEAQPPTDTRTLADLANEAIRVQDACNLSGLAISFAKSISRLRVLMHEAGTDSTNEINGHPICVAWTCKLHDLAVGCSHSGLMVDKAFSDCHDIIEQAKYRAAR